MTRNSKRGKNYKQDGGAKIKGAFGKVKNQPIRR